MNKIKHSKYKNTAILYEVLVKQLMYDAMQESESKAINLIKRHFNKNTELAKELKLYKSIYEGKFNSEDKAIYFIDRIIEARRRLNNNKLRSEKHNLVGAIKENYNLEDFFKSSIKNYKELASIYQIFEYNEVDHPVEINKCKITLCENLVKPKEQIKETRSEDMDNYLKQSPDIRSLSYKLMVDSFNQTSSGLNNKQKEILRHYITNTNGQELLEYFKKEAQSIKGKLDKLTNDNNLDSVVSIKVNEASNLLCKFKNLKIVNENHIYSLLKYHELLSEVNRLRRVK